MSFRGFAEEYQRLKEEVAVDIRESRLEYNRKMHDELPCQVAAVRYCFSILQELAEAVPIFPHRVLPNLAGKPSAKPEDSKKPR